MSKKRKFTGWMVIIFILLIGSITIDSLGYNPLWALVGMLFGAILIGIDMILVKRRKKASQNQNIGL